MSTTGPRFDYISGMSLYRLVSYLKLASALLCCTRSQGQNSRLHSGKNVRGDCNLYLDELGCLHGQIGMKIKSSHLTAMLLPSRYLEATGVWELQNDSWCSPVRLNRYLRFIYDVPYSFIEQAMSEVYRAEFVSLHVRKSNRAAIGLYRDTLGFSLHQVEKGYCEYACWDIRIRPSTHPF